MASVSPPKPWERASTAPSTAASYPTTTTSSNPAASSTSTTSTIPPSIPDRPSSLSAVVNRTASTYSPYSTANRFGAGAAGASPYGGYSSYSSPYSRFGGGYSGYGGGGGGMYGSSLYGSMGGGGMYGAMGGGMYGQPGMMAHDPNDPNSLTNVFSQSTQATFQVLENLVGAFSGVAQMLESTYFATQSGFFAMVSVAEQFSNLRTTLGSVLGIFTLIRYVRTLFAKITGRPLPADATALTPSAFASFQSGSSSSSPATLPNGRPVPSKKPFLLFITAVIGLPYLMSKLIRNLAAQQQQQQQQAQQQQQQHQYDSAGSAPFDPKSLEFCRVLYDFPPPTLSSTALAAKAEIPASDISVKANDLVAVLSKLDPMTGLDSEWWQCRTRDRQVGWLPGVYLKPITARPDGAGSNKGGAAMSSAPAPGLPAPQESSRVNTLSSVFEGGSMTSSRLGEPMPVPVTVGNAHGNSSAGDTGKFPWQK